MARIASESDGLRLKGRRYGSLEPDDFSDDDDLLHEERFHHSNKNDIQTSAKHSRRWSVMEKLERHYGGDSEGGKFRNISSKCVFATLMLTAFIVCGWYFTRTILFNIQLNPELYDFIVVGGGPAGTVVTRRLLDEGAYVLLLEAGEFTQFTVVDNKHGPNTAQDFASSPSASISEYDIPLLWSSVAQATQSHWGHFNALNVNPFKGLGGSAMEGAMLNVWAVSADVVSWGVSGWAWENLLDAYNHLELFNRDSGNSQGDKNQEERGTEGFLPTTETGCLDALGRSFVDAATEVGESYIGGFNSHAPRVGVGCYETTIADGVRVSPPTYLLKSYLESASKAPRLTLRTKATVRRVILSKEASSSLSIGIITRRTHKKKPADTHTASQLYRAIGVEYELDGTIHYAYLKNGPSRNSRNNAMARNFESLRCVVLAAGSVRTPALLLNSGVGPAEELRAAGLEAKVDSDLVGKGLRDHVAVGIVYEASESISTGNCISYGCMSHTTHALENSQ
jgi:choline dehydrogenase